MQACRHGSKRSATAQVTLGRAHQALIPKGATVFADPVGSVRLAQLEAPEEFRPDRPDYHYLHFATGLHSCYGRYISQVQILQILKPLLKLPGLRQLGPGL